MAEEFDAVVERVRERTTPDDAERERLRDVVATLRDRAEAAVAELPVEADVLLAGSTARDTWLAGERDVDLFVRFPPDLAREELETHGLAVGHAVLPAGREEYAEHPYVTGVFEGFDVDLVPCYDVADATEIRSAVDRTPFHSDYIEDRVEGLAGDVRVAKQFLTAFGAYGSDLRTRGFSGYLVELLVVEFDGFRTLVEAGADWRPPVTVDPAGHAARSFDDPLTVVDPTDPERNVAAVLSATNLARFQHHARALLTDPSVEAFFPDPPAPYDADAVRAAVADRGTTPVAVRVPAPAVVDDQLYPQLDKSLAGVADALERRGFDPLRTARFADETAVLLVECEVARRPAVERHVGPPVGVRDHAERFHEAHADGAATGPFIEAGRYVVERERAFRTPGEFLRSEELGDVALGPDVADALGDREVLVGAAVADLAGEFGEELARYFEPSP